MADAQALNATFFALKKREKSGVLLSASLTFIVAAALLAAGFAALAWTPLTEIGGWYMRLIQASGDPEAMANIGFPTGFLTILPLTLLWLFVIFVLYAAYEAACQRWLLRGETGGLFGLTLGADTWRVYCSYWMWFGLYLVGSTALSFAMTFVIFALAMSGVGGGMTETQMGGSLLVAAVTMYVLYYGAMIYFAVRFAPGAATSIARRRFAFFDAWKVTRGRFWALFGSYFLLFLLHFIAGIVLSIVAVTVLFASVFANVDFTKAATDPNAFLTAYFDAFAQILSNPAALGALAAYYVVATLIGLFFTVLIFGVSARAVQAALEDGKIKPPVAA